MFRVPTIWLVVAFVGLASACAAQQRNAAASAAMQPKEVASQESLPDDVAARELLDLANQARAHAGVAPLQLDQALSQAAGSHTAEMAAEQQLSHQFSDETSLLQRLTADSDLHVDQAAENVAFAPTVERAHDALMHSPPHRENLLNARYNVAGISVVRSGRLLYVTEDFAHSLPVYSGDQAEEAVVRAVSQARSQAGVASLHRTSMSAARTAACSMAQRKSLDAPQLPGRHVVRYTSFSPEEVPAGAVGTVTRADIGELSVGTCYGQSSHNAGGMYYVVLVLK